MPLAVALENIIRNPFGSAMAPYASAFDPFPGIFFAIAIIGAPTLAVALKTKGEEPPLITLALSSAIVGGIIGQWGHWLIVLSGILFGILLYRTAWGSRR